MPSYRRVVALVLAIPLAWAIAGCGIGIREQSSSQRGVIGRVQVSTTFCTTADAATSDNSSCLAHSKDNRGQALVGYRIPQGSSAPETLVSTGDLELTYTQDAAYTSYLNQQYPKDGASWIGYRSEVHESHAGDDPSWTLTPRFSLPNAGEPYPGPFAYATTAGYRDLAAGDDGSAPVVCVNADGFDQH